MRVLSVAYLASLILLALAAPLSAQGGWKANALPGDARFEVLEGPSATAQAYWCAAGQHAQRQMSAKGGTRIYLLNALGNAKTKPGVRAVGFTISPDDTLLAKSVAPGQNGNYSVSVDRVGFTLTVIHALNFCVGSGRE